jgi:hypothetical protein
MGHIGFTVVGVAFWAFLAISAVAGIVGDYKKRRLELEPLRTAIERGQQLDAALVEHLMMRERHDSSGSRLEPLHFRIGGIVTVAAGAGVAILAFFIDHVAPTAFYPVLGAGVLAICIAIGLLVCAQVVEHHNRAAAAREARSSADLAIRA